MAKVAAIPVVCETAGAAGIEAGAAIIAAQARQLAPRRTGRLAASIVPTPVGVAVTAPYAGFVEFGTVYMQAEAYLEPAVERTKPAVEQVVTKTVQTALYAL